jgi:hypothetical protein
VKAILTKGIEHLVFSNLLVSLSIGFLCSGICCQLNISNPYWYGLFVFSSTLLTYNIQRFIKSTQSVPHPTNHILWVLSHKKELFYIGLISISIAFYSFYQLYNWNLTSFMILSISLVISILYVYKIKSKSLRDTPYLKIHLIAIIWVIALGIFELVNEQIFEFEKWIFVLIHYFYVIAVTIPFDIRDLKYDDPKKRTIPQVIGVLFSKMLSFGLMVLYFILAIYFKPDLLLNFYFHFSILISLLLILGIKNTRNEFYYSGLMEGSILIVGLSLLL